MAGGGVRVDGLDTLVANLKGPLFRDVNRELRAQSRSIAAGMVPDVAAAVRRSRAPQAAAMAATVRPVSDRVPVVAVARVNPRFSTKFKGGNTKRRRNAMALGVVAGPAGPVNYYKIGRDPSWGPLGDALKGNILRHAEMEWLDMFCTVLAANGFNARGGGR